jgi:hypothetical protein
MDFFKKLLAFRNALNYGEQLANATTWKKSGIAIGALSGLLAIVFGMVPGLEGVDVGTIDKISNGIFAVGTVYQLFIHVATTKKLGLRS